MSTIGELFMCVDYPTVAKRIYIEIGERCPVIDDCSGFCDYYSRLRIGSSALHCSM